MCTCVLLCVDQMEAAKMWCGICSLLWYHSHYIHMNQTQKNKTKTQTEAHALYSHYCIYELELHIALQTSWSHCTLQYSYLYGTATNGTRPSRRFSPLLFLSYRHMYSCITIYHQTNCAIAHYEIICSYTVALMIPMFIIFIHSYSVS